MSDLYVLLGNPVAHSLSPQIHSLFAKQTGEDIIYEAVHVPTGQFETTIRTLIQRGVRGANVTLPLKLDAIAIADTVTPRASDAAAANTLVFGENNTILADNTDGAGLILDLERLAMNIAGLTVMIIGAGGACRGILQPLLAAGANAIYIVNRTLSHAQQIVQDCSDDNRVRLCPVEQFADCQFDAIINASSAGVSQQLPDFLPATIEQNVQWGYDLFYSHQPTVFVQWLRRQNIACAYDGIGMLVGQAAESFFIWRDIRPEITPVIETLHSASR